MEVPSAVLEKLVCERCSGYLSRGPVHLLENSKYRCGRCPWTEDQDEEEGIRVEAYEELAKLMTFPCRYKKNGCTSKVPFLQNKQHEEACRYRDYLCPVTESGQDVLGHCQQDDPTKVHPESSGEGTSRSSTVDHATPPVQTLELKVECGECWTLTEPVYRGSWLCRVHAPEQRTCMHKTQGCRYSDISMKCQKHENYYCQYRTWCSICVKDITGTTLGAHYTRVHGDITHRAGTVCTVSPVTSCICKRLILECDFGRALCAYRLRHSDLVLWLSTPLPSAQLYRYRCTVVLSHPVTGHTLTCTPGGEYRHSEDWFVCVPLSVYNAYVHDSQVNITINITKIEEPSQSIV